MQSLLLAGCLVAAAACAGGVLYALVFGTRWVWRLAVVGGWAAMVVVSGVSAFFWLWYLDVDFGGDDRLLELVAEGEAVLEATAKEVPELGDPEISVFVDDCFLREGQTARLSMYGPEASAAYLDDVGDAWERIYGVTVAVKSRSFGDGLEAEIDAARYTAFAHRSGSLGVSMGTGCVASRPHIWSLQMLLPVVVWAVTVAGWVAMVRAWPVRNGPWWRRRHGGGRD